MVCVDKINRGSKVTDILFTGDKIDKSASLDLRSMMRLWSRKSYSLHPNIATLDRLITDVEAKKPVSVFFESCYPSLGTHVYAPILG